MEGLARYLIMPPVSLERLTYDRKNQQVYYQGKAETHTYQPLDFLAYVSLHIPDKGEQIVRYYGWYSNKNRGLRKKDKPASPLSPLGMRTSPIIRKSSDQHGQD